VLVKPQATVTLGEAGRIVILGLCSQPAGDQKLKEIGTFSRYKTKKLCFSGKTSLGA
jgi:hypothetical protein